MLLTAIFVIPLLGALLTLLIPSDLRVLHRGIAILATGCSAVLSLFLLFGFQSGVDGFQFVTKVAWVPSIGLNYHVGVDGINLGLVVMAAWVAFAATLLSHEIRAKEKLYYSLLQMMCGGIIGAFASLDVVFFYAMHELALIPTFIMIGVWGRGERKAFAAYQMAIYLSLGAMLVLAGIICLYVGAGAKTFDMTELAAILAAKPMALSMQKWLIPLLVVGFGILVGLVPFHSWAPAAYSAAPTAVAMLHAGVLKKFGLYGILRLVLPMMPDELRPWMEVLVVMALINALYCGLIAIRQRCFAQMISYSSLSHVGFIFLGLAVLTQIGLSGAVFLMVAHGFLAALLFGLNGWLYNNVQTTDMDKISGLLQKVPFIGFVMAVTLLAGCGLPFFGNFWGELMVLVGTWQSGEHWIVAFAVFTALIVSGVYMLRTIRGVLHGESSAVLEKVRDAGNLWRRLPYVLLVVGLLAIGVYPMLLTRDMRGAVETTLQPVNTAADNVSCEELDEN